MRLIDYSSNDAAAELAYDASLFQATETGRGDESLRFWETPRTAVIVSRSARLDREIHEDACRADGVPIVRRISGGGPVVVGPGCLNYTLVFSLDLRPELREVARSYSVILNRIVRALDLPGLAVEGMSDVTLEGRKVSGCAQRRGRRALLHHGTWLYDFDVKSIGRYLKEPALRPTYRTGRSHLEFVANVPMSAEEVRRRIATAFTNS